MEYKLILGTGIDPNVPAEEEILLIKEAGFDGFFSDVDTPENIIKYSRIAEKEGLIYHSHHAPFGNMDVLWEGEDKEARPILEELKAQIDACFEAKVPILVLHVIIGMERHTPNDIGCERFYELALYAKEKGIKIAFENTEGEEYLKAVLDKCGELENVGFCYDSGHEKCYNYDKDMLALHGDRLISTHLNDNLGMKDKNIKTWYDDLHLLPFDGNADWENIVKRLKKAKTPECLTFELSLKPKPERDAHDRYIGISFSEYIKEAYKRADKVRKMMQFKNFL